MTAHESLRQSHRPAGPTDRNFGFVFATVFLLLALAPLFKGHPVRWWAVALSAVFAAFAALLPGALNPLNRAWMKLGLALERITGPIFLGIIFYGLITPMAALQRLRGRDPLRLKFEPSASSYWLPRPPSAAQGAGAKDGMRHLY